MIQYLSQLFKTRRKLTITDYRELSHSPALWNVDELSAKLRVRKKRLIKRLADLEPDFVGFTPGKGSVPYWNMEAVLYHLELYRSIRPKKQGCFLNPRTQSRNLSFKDTGLSEGLYRMIGR